MKKELLARKNQCVLLCLAILMPLGACFAGNGAVSGTISDSSSTAVEGAYVYLVDTDWDGDPYGNSMDVTQLTITSSDGSYTLPDVLPSTYDLIVKPSEHEVKVISDIVVTADETTTQDVTTPDAAQISGIVKDTLGNPISGARIYWELDNGWESNFTVSSETGTEGTYSFWTNAGTVDLKVTYSPLRPEITKTVVCTSGNTYTNQDLVAPSGSISGKLTEYDGTTAIEAASVTLWDSNDNIVATTRTDSLGDYEFENIAQGTYTVKTEKDSVFLKVENVQVTTSSVTANLRKQGGKITGNITDSGSNAVTDAKVTAIDSDGERYSGTVDASGNYTIDSLTSDDYTVQVFPGNGLVNEQIEDVAVVNGQTTASQNFVLGSDGIITGTVVNSSQSAISGAQVLAFDADQSVTGSATTDSSGNYTLRNIPSGTYTIMVTSDDYVSDSITDISVTVDQTTSGQNLTLSGSGAVITGTVYESDGTTPSAGAIVAYFASNGSIGLVIADSQGVYITPELAAGTYTMAVTDSTGTDSEVLTDVSISGTSTYSGEDITFE